MESSFICRLKKETGQIDIEMEENRYGTDTGKALLHAEKHKYVEQQTRQRLLNPKRYWGYSRNNNAILRTESYEEEFRSFFLKFPLK